MRELSDTKEDLRVYKSIYNVIIEVFLKWIQQIIWWNKMSRVVKIVKIWKYCLCD